MEKIQVDLLENDEIAVEQKSLADWGKLSLPSQRYPEPPYPVTSHQLSDMLNTEQAAATFDQH